VLEITIVGDCRIGRAEPDAVVAADGVAGNDGDEIGGDAAALHVAGGAVVGDDVSVMLGPVKFPLAIIPQNQFCVIVRVLEQLEMLRRIRRSRRSMAFASSRAR
jgi:hypothetical protein